MPVYEFPGPRRLNYVHLQEGPQEPASVVADDGTTRKPYPRRRRNSGAPRPLPEDDGKQTGTRVVCPTLEDPRWHRDLSAMNCDLGWPGVYLLWSEGSIVYVGQSGRCLDRVAEHRREAKKRFDKVWVLPCPDHAERLRVEAMLMLEHMPKYNRALCLGFDKTGRCYELGFVLAKTRKRQ